MLQTVYPGGAGRRKGQSRSVPIQDSWGCERAGKPELDRLRSAALWTCQKNLRGLDPESGPGV